MTTNAGISGFPLGPTPGDLTGFTRSLPTDCILWGWGESKLLSSSQRPTGNPWDLSRFTALGKSPDVSYLIKQVFAALLEKWTSPIPHDSKMQYTVWESLSLTDSSSLFWTS